MLSPGIPKTSDAVHAPATAALIADPPAAMPSSSPFPNGEASLEKRCGCTQAIQTAMFADDLFFP